MRIPRYRAFERQALRKLRQLEIAGNLNDLRIPPGNHLEALSGDREGQYSIRINGQFRICFFMDSDGASGCGDRRLPLIWRGNGWGDASGYSR